MTIMNTQSIKVPIDGSPPFEYIIAKQGEISSRQVEVTLLQNNAVYTIPSDTTARVNYYKPDGNKVINDCTISDNKVIVTYTQQMLAAAGTGFAEIQLYKGDSVLISATFYTKIVESVSGADSITSDCESESFTKLLVETTQARDSAQNARAAAEKATTAANNAANAATAAAKTAQDAAAAVYTDRNLVTMKQVKAIVEGKKEKEVFTIGDRITVPWTDKATNATYAAVMDVVHFGDVELEDGETTNAMFLQWHYCTPFEVQYDAPEAEVATEATFSADYNYYTKNSDGSFSLATVTTGGAIPAGTTYYHSAIKDTSGNICRYGYNRWSHSAIRQWLNSKAGVNAWWTAQHKGDVKPAELATKAGFLTGFDDDFLSCLTPIKIVTVPNTISEPDKNTTTEITYDKIFLPSMEQMYCAPQESGEGDYWEYWKRASRRTTPCAQWQTYPEMITYAIENHNSAQYVRLRSAYRGSSYGAWCVYSSGTVSDGYGAYNSMRCAPACAITGAPVAK